MRKNDFIVGVPLKQAALQADLKTALNPILIPLYYNGVPECYLNGDRYCVLGGLKLISLSKSIRFSNGCSLLYLIAICWLHHPAVVSFFLWFPTCNRRRYIGFAACYSIHIKVCLQVTKRCRVMCFIYGGIVCMCVCLHACMHAILFITGSLKWPVNEVC